MSRCCEIACRDEPSPCLAARREQISKSVCPFRSVSSSRIVRRVGSAKALKTSPTHQNVMQADTCLSTSGAAGLPGPGDADHVALGVGEVADHEARRGTGG